MKQKNLFFIITILSLMGLAVALISQHVFEMRPCAWCVFQRLILIVCALIGFIGFIASKCLISTRITAVLGIAASISGVVSAWYQYSVASNMFSCSQTFADKFMLISKLDTALPWLFGIYATCADAKVTLLNIDYAIWGLILFLLIGILNLFSFLKR